MGGDELDPKSLFPVPSMHYCLITLRSKKVQQHTHLQLPQTRRPKIFLMKHYQS